MWNKLIFLCLLIVVIFLGCKDASPGECDATLEFLPRRRAITERKVSSYSQEEIDHDLKLQVAGPGKKSTGKENSAEPENSSNMENEGIVYNIDYHGATTHPTPTPKHPKP